MKVQLIRKGIQLLPYAEQDREIISNLDNNYIWKVDIKKSRNPAHHALVFGLARCTIANAPEDSSFGNFTPYQFIKALMLEIGQTDNMMYLSGEVVQIPKSIAFENMSEDEFTPISEAMFKVCAGVIGVEVTELRKNYIEYL